jgi:hypothetical protein
MLRLSPPVGRSRVVVARCRVALQCGQENDSQGEKPPFSDDNFSLTSFAPCHAKDMGQCPLGISPLEKPCGPSFSSAGRQQQGADDPGLLAERGSDEVRRFS